MKTIAFVGLGAMGRPMARNLIEAGFAVQGYDQNPAGLEDLKAAGGVPTGSAKEAFAGAGTIMLMVVNAAEVEAVLFSNGALEAAPAPKRLFASWRPVRRSKFRPSQNASR
jgi:3-hydroxyisobutyrate dehydrogenase